MFLVRMFSYVKNYYQTKLTFAHLPCSKANLLTPGCREGKYSVYLQGTKQGEWVANA